MWSDVNALHCKLTIFSSNSLAFSFAFASLSSSSSILRLSSSLLLRTGPMSERLYGGVTLGSKSLANSTNLSYSETPSRKTNLIINYHQLSRLNPTSVLSVVLIACWLRQINSHLNWSQMLLQGFQHQLATRLVLKQRILLHIVAFIDCSYYHRTCHDARN